MDSSIESLVNNKDFDEINRLFAESVSFPHEYTMKQKIRSLKASETTNRLRNNNSFIYDLFLQVASGNILYITHKGITYEKPIQSSIQIISGISGDHFSNFVERNFEKFNLDTLSYDVIKNNYKKLFVNDNAWYKKSNVWSF